MNFEWPHTSVILKFRADVIYNDRCDKFFEPRRRCDTHTSTLHRAPNVIRRGGHTSKDSAWHLSISTISRSGLVHWWWCLGMGAPIGPQTTSASCTVATSRRVCVRVGLSSISIQKVLWFLSWAEGVTGNHRFCDDSRSSDTCDSTRACSSKNVRMLRQNTRPLQLTDAS